MACPGALSYLAYGLIHYTGNCFFFTLPGSDDILTRYAFDTDDTLRVAFTA
jgi:hypothetical protein